MNGPVRGWIAALLCAAGLSVGACQTAGPKSDGVQARSAAGSAAAGKPAAEEFYTPTANEWRQYLSRMESWMNEDAKDKLIAAKSAKDPVQMRRSVFKFEPGFDQPMPDFDAPGDWHSSYLILVNTNDEPVMVSINSVPFGRLKPGQRYILPVSANTRYSVSYYVPERNLYLQQAHPLHLLAHFTRDVR